MKMQVQYELSIKRQWGGVSLSFDFFLSLFLFFLSVFLQISFYLPFSFFHSIYKSWFLSISFFFSFFVWFLSFRSFRCILTSLWRGSVCLSFRPSATPSVHWSVGRCVTHKSKSSKKCLFLTKTTTSTSKNASYAVYTALFPKISYFSYFYICQNM